MHSAPSVSYPMGPSRVAKGGLWGLWLGGLIGAVAALAASDTFGPRAWILVAAVLLAFIVLRQSLSEIERSDGSTLHFDGQRWALSGARPVREGRVEASLDFQSWMLLSLSEPGRSRRWLFLERATDPQRWLDLRRAVYSRAPTVRPDASAAISPAPGASSSLS